MLARTLKEAIGSSGAQNGQLGSLVLTQIDQALRDFERERTRRKLKISVKSNLMGFALQIPFPPVSLLACLRPVCQELCRMLSRVLWWDAPLPDESHINEHSQ